MLSRKPIMIYYFSGTGNTLLIAKKIQKAFEVQKYEVILRKITMSQYVDLLNDCHLGIVFPVAMQSTFPIVWDFISKLPKGNNKKVFMADTMERFSGGIVGPMKKYLERKGYKCIGSYEFKMATSMQMTEKKVKSGKRKNENALIQAEKYVQTLIDESSSWGRIPILSDAIRAVSKGRNIWTTTSKKIKINYTLCINCRICEKHCPTGAIHFINERIEIGHEMCIACMRCINYCPKNAFTFNEKSMIQKQIVRLHEL